jgi:hypothetical protein
MAPDTAVLEIGGDARRPKRVVADLGRDVGVPRTSLELMIIVERSEGRWRSWHVG